MKKNDSIVKKNSFIIIWTYYECLKYSIDSKTKRAQLKRLYSVVATCLPAEMPCLGAGPST